MKLTLRHQIVIALLAAADAAFIPLRKWAAGAGARVYQARRTHAQYGTPWHSRLIGGTATDVGTRKLVEAELTSLASEGLVLAVGSAARRTNVKLTAEGDALARAWADMPGMADAAPVLDLARDIAGDGWCSEELLCNANGPDRSKMLALLEDWLLPALVAGHAESNADHAGHVCYRVESKPHKVERLDVAAVPGAFGFYRRSLARERSNILNRDPADRTEIGLIPLRAGEGIPADLAHLVTTPNN